MNEQEELEFFELMELEAGEKQRMAEQQKPSDPPGTRGGLKIDHEKVTVIKAPTTPGIGEIEN